MLVFALGGGVNIVLNVILIPRHGIEGAAVATLVAQVLVFGALMIRLYVRFHLFEYYRALVLVASAALAVGATRLGIYLLDGALHLTQGAMCLTVATIIAGIIHVALAVALGAISPARLWVVLDRRIHRPN